MNVVASFILLVAIAIALANVFWQYRSAKRLQGLLDPGDALVTIALLGQRIASGA